METKAKKGTTTVGVVCKDGVVLAADMRASLGHLAMHRVDKVLKVTDSIGMTTAGLVADLQILHKYLKAEMKIYELETGKSATVDVASNLMATILYGGRQSFFPYLVGVLLGGKSDEGFKLFSLESAGSSIKDDYTALGSGMEIALAVLQSEYKKDMLVAEGVELAVKSVSTAMSRDVFSGEDITVAVIDNSGFRMVEKKELSAILKK